MPKKDICINGHDTTIRGRNSRHVCRECHRLAYHRDRDKIKSRRATPEGREKHRLQEAKPERRAVTMARRDAVMYNLLPGDRQKMKDFQQRHPVFHLLLNGPGATKQEAVEHRHSDGFIRGVMAGMLNRAYGLIERLYPRNTAEVLKALAEFHENPPAPKALGEGVYGLIGKAKQKKVMKYGPDGSSTPKPRRDT